MAIIKLGTTVVGIRGSIGGITFSENKGGPYAKSWAHPTNPISPLQSAERARLATLPDQWRSLTQVQRDSWDTFAALPAQELFNSLGESYFISGFGWFNKVNIRLQVANRSIRDDPPIQSRPAAPVFTSLVLPFLANQATKVTYPAGTFEPDFDSVILTAVTPSIGIGISPQFQTLMKTNRNPPDEDDEFVAQYQSSFGQGNSSLKGFGRLFRQTTDGLRSAAATASFISTDTPAYAATAKNYDSTTNFALRGADLTDNADSKILLMSTWFRVDGGDGTFRNFFENTTSRINIFLDGANFFRYRLRNSAAAEVLSVRTSSTFIASSTWHHVLWSVDLATSQVQLAIDGSAETPVILGGPVDHNIDYTRADHSIGAAVTGVSLFNGCLSELYFNNVETLDITIPANLAKFISPTGDPIDLGETGAFPTGTQPIIYVRDADASNNRGSGGNYVNQAALLNCSTSP